MSIIVGTDLSEASTGALQVALALGKLRGDREVVLVHVADEDDERALAALRPQVDAQAQQAKATAGGLAIRVELIVGPTDKTLARFADTESSDLIIIAARSRGQGSLGSTANSIISHTDVPVIVVRDPAPWLAFAADQRALRLLVGIDDSAVCDLGIQWTHRMRTLGKIDVVLGAIYYPDDACELYGLDRKSMVDRDPVIERMMERDLLRRFGASSGSVVARPRRGLGRIGDHVVELANEEKVDAIIVGTGQKSGLGKLGSVSSVIVGEATQSVICVPPQADVPTMTVPVLRSALVATDLSQFSNRAVPYAFAACEPDAEIHIVHILDEDDDDDVDIEEIRKQLLALAPVGAKQKVLAHVVAGDDAAKTVAQTAARLGVDVICMCSHGRSGITRALVGSVADRLLRATRLPVLVLRPA